MAEPVRKTKREIEGSPPVPAVKRRKTTCRHCRQRKSKCDGLFPRCSTCKAYNTHCVYDKPPSLAYVRSLESKIESLSKELNHSRGSAHNSPERARNAVPLNNGDGAIPPPPITPLSGATTSPIDIRDESPIDIRNRSASTIQWVSEISNDGKGGVSYHNPTSAIHEPPRDHSPSRRGAFMQDLALSHQGSISRGDTTIDRDETTKALVLNAAEQRQHERASVEAIVLTADYGVSKEIAAELLKLYWCWIHPAFVFVYRPAFTGDMATAAQSGSDFRYFSDTLLRVIFAHSSRFLANAPGVELQGKQLMESLLQNAYTSLGRRISEPSSVPTIQALLQQSAREVAFGRASQGWLYSGMASRMAIDLGIHLPNDKLQSYVKSLTSEEVEIRKRTFWSCYTWDKAISLYLGRMPGCGSYESLPKDFMDNYTETELWEPYYGTLSTNTSRKILSYPPVEAKVMSTFTGLCKLCIIINDLMLQFYGSSPSNGFSKATSSTDDLNATTASKNSAFIRFSADLRTWWSSLPPKLQLNPNNLPALSPPPHVVSLNLLYNTTLILLHRPFIVGTADHSIPAVQRSYQICLSATSAIHDLLQLLITTFGHEHITYLNCYCTYIAATIAVLYYQREGDGANTPSLEINSEKLGLRFFLDVLQKTARAMPALSRSVDIIKGHVHTILEQQKKKQLASLFPDNHISEFSIKPTMGDANWSIPLPQQHQVSSTNPAMPGTAASLDIQPSFDAGPNTIAAEPAMYGFGELPAFPGQQLTEFTLDIEAGMLDPATRAALMGLHLDPHIQSNHDMQDWDYGGFGTGLGEDGYH